MAEKIDVYAKWMDACEKHNQGGPPENEVHGDKQGRDEDDEGYDDEEEYN